MKRYLLALALFTLSILAPQSANAASKFLVLCTTACTWDNTNDAIWSTTSGGTNNTTHPVAGDAVTVDANSCVGGLTCTITGGAVTLSMTSLTMGACTASTTGCILAFNTNNTNFALTGGLSIAGTGTRTFNCGTGTFTFSGTGLLFDASTQTNLTFSCGSATFSATANSATYRQFAVTGGSLTIGTLSISANASGGAFSITGGFNLPVTFTNVSITAPNRILLGTGTFRSYAFTNGFTLTGSSGSYISFVADGVGSAVPTISSANAMTCTWCAFGGVKFDSGGSITATNSFDLGDVTISGGGSKSITAPATGGGGGIIGG